MESVNDPPFRSVAIVGLGLIGGSIALGLRDRWSSCRITGIDSRPVLAHALGSGAVDHTGAAIEEIGHVDLIVLAAPVRQNIELLAAAARHAAPDTVITDVGGTKQDIVRAAASIDHPERFVGAHPIGGAEKGGFGFARPDLFKGRPWIFTPTPDTAERAIADLRRMVEGLGATPLTIPADQHDRVMAFVSHLPQLAASALMQVAGSGATAEGLAFAGRGLIDTTRLAASPANVWRDICSTNEAAIGDALDQLIALLTTLRAGLRQGETIDTLFADAARWRAELMKLHQ